MLTVTPEGFHHFLYIFFLRLVYFMQIWNEFFTHLYYFKLFKKCANCLSKGMYEGNKGLTFFF